MLEYNERVVFNNGYYADVQLVFYGDGSGQGEIYPMSYRSRLLYHIIINVGDEKVLSYTESPCYAGDYVPCDIHRMANKVANGMKAVLNKEVDFRDGVF